LRYKEKKAIEEAMAAVFATSATENAVGVIAQALTSTVGRRQVGVVGGVVADTNAALSRVVAAFPPRSQGRAHVVGLAASTMPTNAVAQVSGMSQRYVLKAKDRQAERKDGVAAIISSASGKAGQQVQKISDVEGGFLMRFMRSEASAGSGQKCRKLGETLYTEQYLWRLYIKYRAECFLHYLEEAVESAAYSGGMPATLTVHQANCWHALWRSKQPGFSLMEVLAERLAEENAVMQSRGVGGVTGIMGDRTSTAGARRGASFDPSKWEIIPRSWKAITAYMAKFVPAGKEELARQGKWKGVTVKSKSDTHFCPLCDGGPISELKLETLTAKMMENPVSLASLKLFKGASRPRQEGSKISHAQATATKTTGCREEV
jgi:hypothetical protein